MHNKFKRIDQLNRRAQQVNWLLKNRIQRFKGCYVLQECYHGEHIKGLFWHGFIQQILYFKFTLYLNLNYLPRANSSQPPGKSSYHILSWQHPSRPIWRKLVQSSLSQKTKIFIVANLETLTEGATETTSNTITCKHQRFPFITQHW